MGKNLPPDVESKIHWMYPAIAFVLGLIVSGAGVVFIVLTAPDEIWVIGLGHVGLGLIGCALVVLWYCAYVPFVRFTSDELQVRTWLSDHDQIQAFPYSQLAYAEADGNKVGIKLKSAGAMHLKPPKKSPGGKQHGLDLVFSVRLFTKPASWIAGAINSRTQADPEAETIGQIRTVPLYEYKVKELGQVLHTFSPDSGGMKQDVLVGLAGIAMGLLVVACPAIMMNRQMEGWWPFMVVFGGAGVLLILGGLYVIWGGITAIKPEIALCEAGLEIHERGVVRLCPWNAVLDMTLEESATSLRLSDNTHVLLDPRDVQNADFLSDVIAMAVAPSWAARAAKKIFRGEVVRMRAVEMSKQGIKIAGQDFGWFDITGFDVHGPLNQLVIKCGEQAIKTRLPAMKGPHYRLLSHVVALFRQLAE